MGTRGSLPSSRSPVELKDSYTNLLSEFNNSHLNDPSEFINSVNPIKYFGLGSHTTNVFLENNSRKNFLIIDAGTGLTTVIGKILQQYSLVREINIVLTHFHWDHIMGLNFFTPIYIPGKIINFYSPHNDLESNIRALFRKPNFPIEFDQLGSEINFYKVDLYTDYKISKFDCSFYKLDHPDPCYGVRVVEDGKSYSHAVDTEATRRERDLLGQDVGLYENCDLLHFDIPYLESELEVAKKGWGHASVDRALEMSARFNVKEVTFGHYTPEVDYNKYLEIKKSCEDFYIKNLSSSDLKYSFSYDGLIKTI